MVVTTGNINLDWLLGVSAPDWNWIAETMHYNDAQFDPLLAQIHFKRKKPLDELVVNRILRFLYEGYRCSADIRYFNELLWYADGREESAKYRERATELFFERTDAEGHHILPHRLSNWSLSEAPQMKETDHIIDNSSLRICLLGFPVFFGRLVKKLKRAGYQVDQYFIPYHTNKRLNAIMQFSLPVKIMTLLAGNFHSYKTLNYSPKDERIGEELSKGNYDLGFHKLDFIIRKNIFGQFRYGLLNDHWGVLPALRGKSTIAYSVLLGIPVTSTIHLIESGIDTGAILLHVPCDTNGAKSIAAIRNKLRLKLSERVLQAISLAGATQCETFENKKEAGLTFYEVHPWISSYIERSILR